MFDEYRMMSDRIGREREAPSLSDLTSENPDERVWWPITPHRDVYVDMSIPFGEFGRVAGRRRAPLWLRAAGYTYDPWQLAQQIGWARFVTGAWAAVIQLTLATANQHTHTPVVVWVPEHAIRLQPPEI